MTGARVMVRGKPEKLSMTICRLLETFSCITKDTASLRKIFEGNTNPLYMYMIYDDKNHSERQSSAYGTLAHSFVLIQRETLVY